MVVVISTQALLGIARNVDASSTLDAPDDGQAGEHFSVVAKVLKRAKKVVAVAGAGISVSAGIPDFRSADGLYNLVKSRYPHAVVKGKDMFDASLFRDPLTTSIFYTFIAELKILSDNANLTKTHHFLKTLNDRGQLLRCYTQNIDCLEARLNLAPKTTTASTSSSASSTPQKRAPPKQLPTLVHLHGALDTMICSLCKTTIPFQDPLIETCKTGSAPACSACLTSSALRSAQGKRALACGVMRPNIVLYGEHHASGADISKSVGVDVKRRPDVVLVMGTSLKVEGVKTLVKNLARACHESPSSSSSTTEAGACGSGGIVVLLNRTRLGKEWESVFDYQILGDVDDCVELLEDAMAKLETLSTRRKPSAAASKTSDGLVQVKLTGMMKVIKSDTASAVASAAAAAVVKKDDSDVPFSSSTSSSAPKDDDALLNQENSEPETAQPITTATRITRNSTGGTVDPKKPIAVKTTVKKPLKIAQSSTTSSQSSTTTSSIRPKTVSNTVAPKYPTKPASLTPAKKVSATNLKCTPSKPRSTAAATATKSGTDAIINTTTATISRKNSVEQVLSKLEQQIPPDTPSKYLQVLKIDDSREEDEVDVEGGGEEYTSPLKEMVVSSEHVRTSSVVMKDGEGSPSKKAKYRSLDGVLAVAGV
ncbi:UNVERIFIED_CONTAM: hypothetical protein HDU68_007778 [Siphonaria sp. JEL0065]|nr:hypothetical protein HDU68_007778 [Siphonaria sp. JEL0065]